jgi:hypothetical protein
VRVKKELGIRQRIIRAKRSKEDDGRLMQRIPKDMVRKAGMVSKSKVYVQ